MENYLLVKGLRETPRCETMSGAKRVSSSENSQASRMRGIGDRNISFPRVRYYQIFRNPSGCAASITLASKRLQVLLASRPGAACSPERAPRSHHNDWLTAQYLSRMLGTAGWKRLAKTRPVSSPPLMRNGKSAFPSGLYRSRGIPLDDVNLAVEEYTACHFYPWHIFRPIRL